MPGADSDIHPQRNEDLAVRLAAELNTRLTVWPPWRGGWKGQADAALVDSVFSTRARYDTVVLPLVHRWIATRQAQPALGRGVSALTAAGRDVLVSVVNNGQFVPGRNHKLKVDAVLEVAECLAAAHLDTAEEIVAMAYAHRGVVRETIERTPGVGRAQSAYLLMLLGVEGVKADTLVTDWVCRVLNESQISQADIESIVAGAAAILERSPIAVDHAIWRTESTARRSRRRRAHGPSGNV